MKIKYLGPSEAVNVGGYGPHAKGNTREYPDDVAEELLETAKKQRFEAVEDTDAEKKAKAKAEAEAKAKAEAEAKAKGKSEKDKP